MPLRDEQAVVIEVGSHSHKAVKGLSEPLGPATLRIESRVAFRAADNTYICGKRDIEAAKADDVGELTFVEPIVAGEVVDWTALTALWSHILYELTGEEPGEGMSSAAILLLVPAQWSDELREKSARIFFELFKVTAFMTAQTTLAALYACNALSGIVIDVGQDKTDIVAILETLPQAHVTLPVGGRQFTEELLKRWAERPPVSAHGQPVECSFELAEQIKRSDICEIPIDSSSTKGVNRIAALDFQTGSDTPLDGNDEGVLDIAAVISKGNTKEYLEQLATEKAAGAAKQKQEVPNAQLERNSFVDENGTTIMVGPERLTIGTEFIGGALADAIYDTITSGGIDLVKRRELWENVVIVGGGAKIKGFREAVVATLQLRFASGVTQPVDPLSPFVGISPYPAVIRPIKIPLHFGEWQHGRTASGAPASNATTGATADSKAGSSSAEQHGVFEEAAFLGGQIIARVAFGDTHAAPSARHYVARQDYVESGPAAVRA
ncbi:Actin-like protein arp9 [Savitreella phatthalungensis]